MIDLREETLVPLREVPRLLPPRASGRRIHISAVYRWAQRGVRGIRLETARVGGTTYTSREALQRFADAGRCADSAPVPPVTPSHRRRQIEAASRRVQAILGARAAP